MGLSYKQAEKILSKINIEELKSKASKKEIYKSPQEYMCNRLKEVIIEMKNKRFSFPAMERFLATQGINISSSYLRKFYEFNLVEFKKEKKKNEKVTTGEKKESIFNRAKNDTEQNNESNAEKKTPTAVAFSKDEI